jgi:solute carrier family 25 phosphate transporter 23/24/25/41
MTKAMLPESETPFLSEVLLALEETQEQRDARIRKLFGLFDSSRKGYLVHQDVEEGFKALSIPCQYKYVNDLLEVCDSNSDGRVDFSEFRRYMDAKELELYSIFKEIDVKHNGTILPNELRSALHRSGNFLHVYSLENGVMLQVRHVCMES